MRTDLVLNYSILDGISDRIQAYHDTITTMQEALDNLKETIQSQESNAIRELDNKLKNITTSFNNKLSTLEALKDILDDYIEDMESLVGAENRSEKVRADKNDIWYNIRQIESPIDKLDEGVCSSAYGSSSWAPVGETPEMKAEREKQERNYTKLENFRKNTLVSMAGRLQKNVADIWNIYNQYIKPFEDKDDTYRSRLNRIYKDHTSAKDKWGNFWDGFGDISLEFIKAFAVAAATAFFAIVLPGWLVVGAIAVIAVGCVIMANVPKEYVPNWMKGAKDVADSIANKAVQVLEDGPMVLVEDIGQGLADQVQTPEGIAALAGEVIGGVAGGYAGAKVKTKIKAKKVKIHQYDDSFDELDIDVEEIELPEGTWEKGPTERGKDIDKMFNDTGETYPVIDSYDNGIVTSVKSRDLNCKTYQNGSKLESTIKKDIDKLAKFDGASVGGTKIQAGDITGKQLQIVVPNKSLTPEQIKAINNAIAYGKEKGIKVKIIVGR